MTKSYDINLTHLAVFDAVAQEGSVSRGATRLLISQPAASKQIKLLERAIGATLFERSQKGVRTTDAGQMLALHARRIFNAKVDAEREIARYHGIESGECRVGASATIGVHLLPR